MTEIGIEDTFLLWLSLSLFWSTLKLSSPHQQEEGWNQGMSVHISLLRGNWCFFLSHWIRWWMLRFYRIPNNWIPDQIIVCTLPFNHHRDQCHVIRSRFCECSMYSYLQKDIGLPSPHQVGIRRYILTLWQKFTKYSQSINSVSKLSVLAKHVLKFIAENFIDLTESVFKSNFTEFVVDRLGMEGAATLLCWGGALSRLFILFVDALLIMIYEVKLFHLQHIIQHYVGKSLFKNHL